MRDRQRLLRNVTMDIMGKSLSGGFPDSTVGKESTCHVGDLGLISGLGRSPGEGKGYPLQYSGLENSMDCIVPWGHKESDMTERLSLSLSIGKWRRCNVTEASRSEDFSACDRVEKSDY